MRILLFLLFAVQVSAQGLSLRKGMVIDSLRINDTINETYSLYLPLKFDGSTPMPVIFIFDGEGRGKSAAHLFQPAAEKQGYLLVSSNDINPENDFETNVLKGVRLIQEVSRIIPIDFEAISVAGFSEGARVATSLPLLINHINGVIYVGDQQFVLDMLKNPKNLVMVGMVGDEQIGGTSMELVSQQLNQFGIRSEFYRFKGGHEWPNPRLISSAVGSLSLQAIRNEKRPENRQLIDELYSEDISLANKLISNERYLMAYDFLDLLQFKYKKLRDVSEVKDKQRQLRKSRNFKDQQREYQKIIEKEDRLRNDFIFYYNEDVENGNFENLGWWNYQKLQLDNLIISEKLFEGAMGNRLLDLLKEISRARITEIEETGSLESRLMANMLGTIFDQKNFEAYKKVISLSTIDGDFQTALFYLEEMLKNGYSDMESLYDLEGTLGLRFTEEFNWLIDKYLGSSKYYTHP